METTDLLVLGGGPAGCAAAITAAQAGRRVILIERSPFPRHRPGETLHPGLEPLFRQLGAWPGVQAANYTRHGGIWIHRGAGSTFEKYGEDASGAWLGFQAPRCDLDRLLLQTAREHGVVVKQPAAAQAVIADGGRVRGVQTKDEAIAAAITVDAGGGGHWLARRLGVSLRRMSCPLLASYGYASGKCPHRDDAPALRWDPTGWTWTACIGPGSYHWTSLGLGHAARRKPGPPEEFRGLEPAGPIRGADVTWRMATAPAGKGYFLAGDAAAVLDPACSHGVLRAILSGIYAGHLAARVMAGQDGADDAARLYGDWLGRFVQHDVNHLTELYSSLPSSVWARRCPRARAFRAGRPYRQRVNRLRFLHRAGPLPRRRRRSDER